MEMESGVIISHSPECGVNNHAWKDCTCDLVKRMCEDGREKFLNHADNCPCHCTCDFAVRLIDYLNT